MEFDKDVKLKVTDIVGAYIKAYPLEYGAFIKQQEYKRQNLQNDWAEVNGYEGVVIRQLNEYPETLAALIKIGLSDSEHMVFQSEKFQKWFGNNFKNFNVTNKKL